MYNPGCYPGLGASALSGRVDANWLLRALVVTLCSHQQSWFLVHNLNIFNFFSNLKKPAPLSQAETGRDIIND